MAEEAILKEYRPYQRILEAFNGQHFRDHSYRHTVQNVRYAACVSAMLMSMVAVLVLCCWYCVETEFDVKMLSFSVPVILSLMQMLLTHFALMRKNCSIHATVEHLQQVIHERESFCLVRGGGRGGGGG